MTAPVKLWHYRLPSVNGEGWAVIVLGSDGFFAAVSDYGNYAYSWGSHHGCADFRSFVLNGPRDWDYFAEKLAGGRSAGQKYNGERTLKAVRQHIIGARRSRRWDRNRARREWGLPRVYDQLYSPSDLERWCGATTIGNAYELASYWWKPNIETFCKQTLARLADLIRAELAAEAA